jgi:hypothetical protein
VLQNQQLAWPSEVHREGGEFSLQQVHFLPNQFGIATIVVQWIYGVLETEDDLTIHFPGSRQVETGEEMVVVGDDAVVDADDVTDQQGWLLTLCQWLPLVGIRV